MAGCRTVRTVLAVWMGLAAAFAAFEEELAGAFLRSNMSMEMFREGSCWQGLLQPAAYY